MIILENVSKEYETTTALNNVNLHIEKGEFVFIVGDSGAGKSTLFRLLIKELEPTSGHIFVDGTCLTNMKRRKIPALRRNIGVVFQDFRLLEDRDVYENIVFAQRAVGAQPREIKKNVSEILNLCGISEKYRNMPRELSGGEQQRVALARALVNRPAILLADEPTGNLDPKNTESIMELLAQVNSQGTTVVVVTHDRAVVKQMNKRTLYLKNGALVNDLKQSES